MAFALQTGSMELKEKSTKAGTNSAGAKDAANHKIVVIIDATKQITKHAVDWALTNVAQAGDCITLLAVIPGGSSGWKFWLRLGGECTQAGRIMRATCYDQNQTLENQINDYCSDMLLQLRKRCDAKKVKVKLKIILAAGKGAAALEARKLLAAWVILDRHMKREAKYFMEQLQCNLVVISQHHSPKILRFNLKQVLLTEEPPEPIESSSVLLADISLSNLAHGFEDTDTVVDARPGNLVYPVSEKLSTATSPDTGVPFTATEYATSPSSASSEQSSVNVPEGGQHLKNFGVATKSRFTTTKSADSSPNSRSNLTSTINSKRSLLSSVQKTERGQLSAPASRNSSFKKKNTDPSVDSRLLEESAMALKLSVLSATDANTKHRKRFHNPMLSDILKSESTIADVSEVSPTAKADAALISKGTRSKYLSEPLQDNIKRESKSEDEEPKQSSLERTSSIRLAVSLKRNLPSGPPPLCSICQHKAPIFGRPPIKFSHGELQKATKNFSEDNFLAEGGFGPVHKGILPDGQHVAVKQHRMSASSQGDKEFCAEVEVLNCAQHRNVVMLIGYCIENGRRLLVYEFVCNGSLDAHLFSKEKPPMEWKSRRKVAVGAARGLRFLHEDCRVGCIIHRDLRPNNILLTHDFEPLVGDFGLARWQPDGELEEETRVIGTFGYLAPEYAQTGQVTEKADVYSFGVVLLELITGRKAIDFTRPKGQQCLTEWARPLMEDHAAYELVDPQLENRYSEYEVYCMLHAASLCIRRDAYSRPRMSQVLRILEGELQGGSPASYTGLSRSPDEFGSFRSTGSDSRLGSPSISSNRDRLQILAENNHISQRVGTSPGSTGSSPFDSGMVSPTSANQISRFSSARSGRARFSSGTNTKSVCSAAVTTVGVLPFTGRHPIIADKLHGYSQNRLSEAGKISPQTHLSGSGNISAANGDPLPAGGRGAARMACYANILPSHNPDSSVDNRETSPVLMLPRRSTIIPLQPSGPLQPSSRFKNLPMRTLQSTYRGRENNRKLSCEDLLGVVGDDRTVLNNI